MRLVNLRRGWLILLLAGWGLGRAGAGEEDVPTVGPSPGVNLAAGRTCTFTQPPNYGYCTGDTDPQDLTDRKFWNIGAGFGFWTEPGTVGWQSPKPLVVGVQMDLGEVAPIGAVTLDSAAGSAQVTYPMAALLFVSDDGQAWHYVTDVINEAVPQDRFTRHRFAADGLNTCGRYVTLYLVNGGFYMFTDEIEVLRGDHPSLPPLRKGGQGGVIAQGAAIPTEGLAAAAQERGRLSKQKNSSLYFLAAAEQAIRSRGGLASPALAALADLREKILARTEVEPINVRRGPPFTRLDREIGQAVGAFERGRGAPALTLWRPQPTLWSPLGPFDRPPGQPDEVSLRADMMVNEYEAVAFNLSNNRPTPTSVEVVVEDLTGDAGTQPASALSVREVVTVEASGFRLYADALPEAEGKIRLPAGLTRQVWLTIHSQGARPGTYHGAIRVRSDSGQTWAIPLTVNVYPVRMSTNPDYLTDVFSYFTWPPAVGREAATARDLSTHYANTQVLHHHYIPWPRTDEAKNPLRPLQPDFTRLDEMLACRPDVKLWILWLGLEFGFGSLGTNVPQGTPEWEAMLREWVAQVRDHLAAKGIGTDRWCFMWVDEPGDDRWKEHVVPFSRLAKQVDPTILVWEDPQVSFDLLRETADACDIYCPPLDYLRDHPDTHQFLLGRPHPAWQYVCASSKEMDPHSYYRLHHWHSFDLGLNGAAIWVYTDDLGTWNDYEGGTSYSMIYEGPDGPITGKRWEAWRDGIEDFELLRQLRTRAEATGRADLKQLLEDSPHLVLENSGQPEALLERRVEILEALAD